MNDRFRRKALGLLETVGHVMPDALFLRLKFPLLMGYKLDLKHPRTFNEKIQWLKLHDRRPEYIQMVDKIAAKDYVAARIGAEHIIPTLAVYDDISQINIDALPEQFVLKCAHDSGSFAICRDKATFDVDGALRKLQWAQRRDFSYSGREWAYKAVPRRILAEKYMAPEADLEASGGAASVSNPAASTKRGSNVDSAALDGAASTKQGSNVDSAALNASARELDNYKFFCFNGEPKYLYVSTGMEAHGSERFSCLTLDWEFAPFQVGLYRRHEDLPPKPAGYEEMLDMARKLSAGHRFLRVDLYQIGDRVYFSELTLYPTSGYMPYTPREWEYKIGDWLEL